MTTQDWKVKANKDLKSKCIRSHIGFVLRIVCCNICFLYMTIKQTYSHATFGPVRLRRVQTEITRYKTETVHWTEDIDENQYAKIVILNCRCKQASSEQTRPDHRAYPSLQSLRLSCSPRCVSKRQDAGVID